MTDLFHPCIVTMLMNLPNLLCFPEQKSYANCSLNFHLLVCVPESLEASRSTKVIRSIVFLLKIVLRIKFQLLSTHSNQTSAFAMSLIILYDFKPTAKYILFSPMSLESKKERGPPCEGTGEGDTASNPKCEFSQPQVEYLGQKIFG